MKVNPFPNENPKWAVTSLYSFYYHLLPWSLPLITTVVTYLPTYYLGPYTTNYPSQKKGLSVVRYYGNAGNLFGNGMVMGGNQSGNIIK